MLKAKGTTPKALRIQLQQQQQEGVVDHHESSFRVLYYGDASAGSVPFMWESHPGTPKHALTESSLPPLTPPPSFQNRLSSMQLTKRSSSKRSGFLRTVFLAAYRKTAAVEPAASAVAPSFSSCSVSSSSSCSSSSSSGLTPTKVWRRRTAAEEEEYGGGGGGGSPTSTLCYGGGFRKGYRVKRAILGFVRNRKA